LNINGTGIRAPLSTDDPFSFTSKTSNPVASAIANAAAINDAQPTTGVRAMASGPVTTGNVTTVGNEYGTQYLYVNGTAVPIDMGAGSTGTPDSPAARRAKVIAAINNTIGAHGVTASDSGTGGISLTTKDGRNLSVWFDPAGNNLPTTTKLNAASFGLASETAAVGKPNITTGHITFDSSSSDVLPAVGDKISLTLGGATYDYVVSDQDMKNGAVDANTLTSNLKTAWSNAVGSNGSIAVNATHPNELDLNDLTSGSAVPLPTTAITLTNGVAGVTAVGSASTTTQSASTLYGTVTLRSDTNAILPTLSPQNVNSVTLPAAMTLGSEDQMGNPVPQSAGRMSFQVGPIADQVITIDLQDFGKNGTITGEITGDVDSTQPKVNIKTVDAANSVIDKLGHAMDNVNAQRSTMGAVMNRLEHVIDNLNTVSMNAEASRSQIQDADYAKASTELARTQIMQQAATAVLAQANTSQQTVLKLLQG